MCMGVYVHVHICVYIIVDICVCICVYGYFLLALFITIVTRPVEFADNFANTGFVHSYFDYFDYSN